ncbi:MULTISPECIES: DUF4123 domain-containing protein [Pseudomonadota]|jgi:hypothetical protein|uniref:DUF4123 domain-containing protein n=2 Tax=Ralstonia pickettii TaxID=329 RepID=R0E6P6_RALPI|nr:MULTISPECIES: DUF4123 domain-containing protein [Pseudomonadota]ENZ77794.1 hypothetical protein OR214_02070 [Ralstonia pickettii OR214]MBL4779369.1 DUF4123 domain-containing protein [Ralstonia sp.]MCM3582104.1 DUF4123 domain-containing protein [Ralstonia pickettii]
MPLDVVERLTQLRSTFPTLRLYALVDGIQYEESRGERLGDRPGHASLFRGTPDGPLAHAGPWLVDVEEVGDAVLHDLARLEQEAPAVTWLIAEADLAGLAQLLQLHLDVRLPDGRIALLRFWDPRVLASLVNVLDARQRDAFFAHIHEWHLLRDGQRAYIRRTHAQA